MKKLPLFLLLLAITLQACNKPNPNSKLTKEELAWLRKTTIENLVFVEGGTFMEGDVGYDDEEGVHHLFGGRNCKPLHEVTLKSYSMLKYEVSFKEFNLFLKATNRKAFVTMFDGTKAKQPQLPANYLIWQEANDYCEWLAKVLNLPISLPSESQWEYAARSRGLAVEHATDNGKLDFNINVAGIKEPMEGFPSGHFPPNPLGIYDMTGSREEWTQEKVVRGVGSSQASIYHRSFQSLKNTGSKGIRLVVNYKKAIKK